METVKPKNGKWEAAGHIQLGDVFCWACAMFTNIAFIYLFLKIFIYLVAPGLSCGMWAP